MKYIGPHVSASGGVENAPLNATAIGADAFAGCDKLKAIYVPKGKVDFFKVRFPVDMQWLIVEEGSALPTKNIPLVLPVVNEIWYTTVDCNPIKGCMQGTSKKSNTYKEKEGKCVIKLKFIR